MKLPSILLAISFTTTVALAADPNTEVAVRAINQLGLELLPVAGKPEKNLLLSPYSIQNALAMTYAGANGKTQAEMSRVLHFPKDDVVLGQSFAALSKTLVEAAEKSVEAGKKEDGQQEAIQFNVANRIFGQEGFKFHEAFLTIVKANYGAPLELLDFKTATESARVRINSWVAEETKDKIKDLIPAGALGYETHLVLTNAAYIKAPWQTKFRKSRTGSFPFHIGGGKPVDVETMSEIAMFGYSKKKGYAAITLPYLGKELQFLILLPKEKDGLTGLEKRVTPALLAECAKLPAKRMLFYLPKIKFEPPSIALSKALQTLGLKTAFNEPRGSADFSRMAPREGDDYLYIGEVFHKTFFALDEESTEAAAATTVLMPRAANGHEGVPMTVKVDRPFLFAIQHVASGACLFLGRVTDPRQ